MIPKVGATQVEGTHMRNFGSKRRKSANCSHETLMRIEVAGMSREVCESCGRVRIGYVENHARAKAAQVAAAFGPDGSSADAA